MRAGERPASVVVVGAEGFLGTELVRQALCPGRTLVTAVCTRPPWRWAARPRAGLSVCLLRRPWWQSAEVLRRLADGADAVVLLAYAPPPPRTVVEEHERSVNAGGTARLAAAAAAGGGRLVLASSAAVYGSRPGRIDETTTPSPETAYGRAKLLAEREVLSAGRACGASVLRISTTYGPGETAHRAIPLFATALLRGRRPVVRGDGGDVRDYVHVRDVARALLQACGSTERRAVVNVGTGTGRSTLDVLDAVSAAVGVPADPQFVPGPAQGRSVVLDPRLLRTQLRVTPTEDFEGAVGEEVRWLRSALSRTA